MLHAMGQSDMPGVSTRYNWFNDLDAYGARTADLKLGTWSFNPLAALLLSRDTP